MESNPPGYDAINRRSARHGLVCRGGFHAGAGDPGTGSIILLGDAGGGLWPAFAAERLDEDNPLDSWTRRAVDPLAREWGARALYPFDGPPHHPFQQWAKRAEGLGQSPIGPLIHPAYGLWRAYRAALVFDAVVEGVPRPLQGSPPCGTCVEKPCLAACPAGAFGGGGLDVPKCLDHIETQTGGDCRERGCRARLACPVGAEHAYSAARQAFHMAWFSHRRGRS